MDSALGRSESGTPHIVTSQPTPSPEWNWSDEQIEQLGNSDFRDGLLAALAAIAHVKVQVNRSRWRSGLHLHEDEPRRREAWFVTSGKITALNEAADAIAELAAPNLTVGKSILKTLREAAESFDANQSFHTQRGNVESASLNRAKLSAVSAICSKISGSAGTQPLNGEAPSPPMERVAAVTLREFLDSLTLSDLHAVSELALEALERRPEAAWEWTVADRFKAALDGFSAVFEAENGFKPLTF